ncbi:hypothetical protein [Streptomyces finlayi]|uniref:hypothetical protein n=1 Tax=Streptomyces finlayi TaxID=67296 RepID=UPI00167346C8|nr:hypothetical protein [Streptomyces finlayi]
MASAWTLPALLGPAVAAATAEATHWRIVFLSLVPPVPVGVLLTLPALRGLGPPEGTPSPDGSLIPLTLVLVVGAGAVLAGLEEQHPALTVPLVLLSAALAVPVLRELLPPGTLTVRRGMPAVMTGLGTAVSAFGATRGWSRNGSLGLGFTVTALAALAGTAAGLRTRAPAARDAPEPKGDLGR